MRTKRRENSCPICNKAYRPFTYVYDDDDTIEFKNDCFCPKLCDVCGKILTKPQDEEEEENKNDEIEKPQIEKINKKQSENDIVDQAIKNKGNCQCGPEICQDPNGIIKLIVEISHLSEKKLVEEETKNKKEIVIKIKEMGNDFFAKKEYNKAEEKYLEALEKNSNEDPKIDEACLNNLGYIHFLLEEVDLAFKYFEATLRVNPQNFKALFRKALCYKNKNLLFEAETELVNVRKLNKKEIEKEVERELLAIGDMVKNHYNKGNEHFYKKKYEMAMNEYNKIKKFECFAKDEKFLTKMAEIYIDFFNFIEAEKYIDLALKINENELKMLMLKAKCQIHFGFLKEAELLLLTMKEKFKIETQVQGEIEQELNFLKFLKKN